MLNPIPISTKEFRDNLAEILEQVAVGGKSYEIQKFGKTKALLISDSGADKHDVGFKLSEHPARGMWKDRDDIGDSVITKAEILRGSRDKKDFKFIPKLKLL